MSQRKRKQKPMTEIHVRWAEEVKPRTYLGEYRTVELDKIASPDVKPDGIFLTGPLHDYQEETVLRLLDLTVAAADGLPPPPFDNYKYVYLFAQERLRTVRKRSHGVYRLDGYASFNHEQMVKKCVAKTFGGDS